MESENILIFYPSSQRAVDQESAAVLFKNMGYNVLFCTISHRGAIHERLDKLGVTNLAIGESVNGITQHLKVAIQLAKIINKHNINIGISHLQTCSIILAMVKWVLPVKGIMVRHYSDNAYLNNNIKEQRYDLILNKLYKYIIVPSKKVQDQLVEVEKAGSSNIFNISYGYDFSAYPEPNKEEVSKIKEKIGSGLVVVTVARLVPMKHHLRSLRALKQLIDLGKNVKLVFVGDGPEKKALKKYVEQNNLEKNVFFEGFRTNVFDYLSVADLFLLLSSTEASNSALKEAASLSKPVLACEGVGDFSEYILHEKTGYLVEVSENTDSVVSIISELDKHRDKLNIVGENLRKEVFRLYEIEAQRAKYEKLFLAAI